MRYDGETNDRDEFWKLRRCPVIEMLAQFVNGYQMSAV